MKQAEFGWPELEEAWRLIQQAFAHYGKTIGPLRGNRRDHMSKLISEGYKPAELAAAVHGYVRWHEGIEKKADGFDPNKWFDPDSIFRFEKIERRIELGLAGPYTSRKDIAKERAQAAQDERSREIAKVMEERRLRAV